MDFRIGLPAWGFAGWKDRYFPSVRSQLASYARVFNTVEGNTSFYAVPDARSVERWRVDVAGTGFRFCFKLPRTVTHERPASTADLGAFFRTLEPLHDHLGPFLLQFPAAVGPADLHVLAALFERFPGEHRYVVEVRHPAFFRAPEPLSELLDRHEMGRVCLDSRPIYHGQRDHPEVRDALHEKPDLPVVPEVSNGLAFIRLILHPDPVHNGPYLDAWVSHVARYLLEGHETYMMIHCPNNLHCPGFASEFHERLRAHGNLAGRLAELASFPVPRQQTLL